MANLQSPAVRIRLFRSTDLDSVRALFLLSMSTGKSSPCQNALWHAYSEKHAVVAYFFMILGAFTSATLPSYSKYKFSGFAMVVIPALGIALYHYLISQAWAGFLKSSLSDDLADISTHYQLESQPRDKYNLVPTTASAFWVAELEDPKEGKPEIVGCIGLDCKERGGTIHAEIRRMCVSPYHQRKGIATRCFQTAITHAEAHNISSLDLATTEFNAGALAFYEKFGVTEIRREMYLGFYGLIQAEEVYLRLKLRS